MKMPTDNCASGESQQASCPCEPSPLPNIECVDRVKKLPIVEAAWNQSAALYNNVKEYNSVLAWTLGTAEATVNKAVEQTLPVVAPIVKKLETPLGMVDKTLCKGLDIVENAVPCIKQEPSQIRQSAKTYCDPAYQQVKTLQELSWVTANQMLKSDVGHVIVGGIDSMASTADKILDFLLPPGEPLGLPRAEKVMQALVTIGGLPNIAARKAYDMLSNLYHLAGQQDLRQNLRTVLTLIQLQDLVSSACPDSDSTASSCNQSSAESSPPASAKQSPGITSD